MLAGGAQQFSVGQNQFNVGADGAEEVGPLRGWRKNFVWVPVWGFFLTFAIILISVGAVLTEEENQRWTEGTCFLADASSAGTNDAYSCQEHGQAIVIKNGVTFDGEKECDSLTAEGWCPLSQKSSTCKGDSDDCVERAQELFALGEMNCWIDDEHTCWSDEYKEERSHVFLIVCGCFIAIAGGCMAAVAQCLVNSAINTARQQAINQQQTRNVAMMPMQQQGAPIMPMQPAPVGAVVAMAPAPMAPRIMNLTLPPNCIGGQVLQVQTPIGTIISVTVPPDAMGGQVLQVTY